MPILDYIAYLQTLSNYISMPADEARQFYDLVQTTLRNTCGADKDEIAVHQVSVLNMAKRIG